MKALRKLSVIALMLLTMSYQAYGATETAPLLISVHVMPTISFDITSRNSNLVVTPEDIGRGYIDIPRGTVVSVKTNTETYFLSFESWGFPVREVWVTVGGRTVILPGGSGIIEEPGRGLMVEETKELSYRFVLSREAAPGTYPWPITINVVN